MKDVRRRRYFDEIEKVFEMEGWKYITDDALNEIYMIQSDALDAKDMYQLGVLKGMAARLHELVRLPEITAALRQEWEESQQENEDVHSS